MRQATALGGRGPYTLQAAIASLHADDPRDWHAIAELYGELSSVTGSPVVELNRAVAVAEVAGPETALELVDRLDLDSYRYLHSTRADFLRRLGRAEEAEAAYLASARTHDRRRRAALSGAAGQRVLGDGRRTRRR